MMITDFAPSFIASTAALKPAPPAPTIIMSADFVSSASMTGSSFSCFLAQPPRTVIAINTVSSNVTIFFIICILHA